MFATDSKLLELEFVDSYAGVTSHLRRDTFASRKLMSYSTAGFRGRRDPSVSVAGKAPGLHMRHDQKSANGNFDI